MYHQYDIERLKKKVEQHEKTISQLIDIIAATNRHLSELVLDIERINGHLPLFTIPQKYLVKKD